MASGMGTVAACFRRISFSSLPSYFSTNQSCLVKGRRSVVLAGLANREAALVLLADVMLIVFVVFWISFVICGDLASC